MYDTILVPTDGSESAERALTQALGIAHEYDATVHALYCVERERYGEPALSSAELAIARVEERGQAILERTAAEAADAGIELTWDICRGSPHVEIERVADEVGADLVIVGYQGEHRTLPDHLGTVATKVVRTLDRPVLTA